MLAPALPRSNHRLPPDFGRVWAAYAASAIGSALAMGALPLVAILELDVSAWQVSLLAVISGLGAAVAALPVGPFVEYQHKRPVMMASDGVCAIALASVPIAAWCGVLTFAQVCVVGAVQTIAVISFGAASGAHLKNLVGRDGVIHAQARLDSTLWASHIVGNPVGGILVTVLGAPFTLVIDAVSYAASAVFVRTIRTTEPPPPTRVKDHRWRVDIVEGWRVIGRTPGVRALFWNATVFGGCIMAVSSLLPLLMVRDLGLGAWAYGLALGAGSVGGLVGALASGRMAGRFGRRRVLLGAGAVRNVWLLPLALAPDGVVGLIVVMVSEFGLLVCAGVFNPTFTAYRLSETPEHALARVQTAWSITQRLAQPVGIALGGALATLFDVRLAILVTGLTLLTATALLPWRQ